MQKNVVSNISAQWWSVLPSKVRDNNSPGIMVKIRAATRPVQRFISARPMKKTGITVSAPNNGGTKTAILPTVFWSVVDPANSLIVPDRI